MFEGIKKMFSGGPSVDFADMKKKGALIIDVRSTGEYAGGHIKGSINIPLDSLGNQLGKLKDKNQAIITCCASGMRSGSAKSMLKSKGYTNVHNGGGWSALQRKL